MKNNKGMSMVELLVCMAMLSVTMVFMYELITNLQAKRNKIDAEADNMVLIADIESTIQKELFGTEDYNFGRNKLNITTRDEDRNIIITKDRVDKVIQIISKNNIETITLEANNWKLKKGIKYKGIDEELYTDSLSGKTYKTYIIKFEDNSGNLQYIKIPMCLNS